MPIPFIPLVTAKFVNAMSPHLLRRYLPAGIDKAQLEQLGLRREELAGVERRFLETQKAARQLKFDEIEKMREVRREEKDYDTQIQRWPLNILPVDILRASEAQGGRSLNIILNVVDTRDADFYKREPGELVSERLDMFHGQPLHLLRDAVRKFDGDVIFYHQLTKSAKISGESLKATLWSLLRSEPTVFIEINMPNANEVKAYISQWGCDEPDAASVSYVPQRLDLSDVSGSTCEQVVSYWLSSLVVSIGDAFRTLHRPHALEAPVFPAFIQENAPPALRDELLQRMLSTYTAAYDGVAIHSSLLASELAARAALTALQFQQDEFAEALLTKALVLHPVLEGKSQIGDEQIALLKKHRRLLDSGSNLYSALKAMRNISVEHDKPSGEEFEQFIRRFSVSRKGKSKL